ncbi:MAG: 3'-5' exonuclease, partial [Clostridia bacterium]|nr:3'-5' exonuclease [Clostridia bacterium]
MRYLFYDVECANCFNGEGKICSFGYVITDTDFNVVEKRDIVINPASRFYLRKKGNRPEIELAYEEDYFKKQPKFDKFYDELKQLLEYHDQIVMGHSILNDVKHMAYQCKRYNLPCIDYRFGDSQLIYKKFVKGGSQVGLARICEEYDIHPEHLHRSDDDAWATMEFVRKFCQERFITLDKLLADNPDLTGSVEDFEVTMSGISVTRSKRFLQRQLEEYIKTLAPISGGALKGKRYCMSKKFERDNADLCAYYCKRVFELGGRYTRNAMRCNTFVHADEEPCAREKSIYADKKLKSRISVISLCDFIDTLG